MLHDGPGETALMTDLEKTVLRSIYESSSEGLRSWQVQKKVDGTKLEVQKALHELLAAGYIGILSMGGGPKYYKISSKTYVLDALDAPDTTTR
jgi:predicted transcriptional regulator